MASTLQTGMSLSRYRVIGPLGAGGMGEVYKAQDTTLERPVALKILPPELVRNDERVRRFIQEAKSASSLNHPNIVTILEIGQSNVASPSGEIEEHPIHYIAMELIDGATLKRKIHEEQTDLRTLLGWLSQAADGLAKAHAAGLIHRDLKPENIMVTGDGFAKVLDFGLAKLSVRKSSDGSTDATAVRADTREGALLGTVAYMSPEQVRGKVVDHRSDIFSFGCILYEAATRQRPFEADSDVEVMHKIMHDKPPAIDEISPEVPAELRRMIRRCMAKDPDRRYQSMRDVALELSEIVDEYEELSASAASRSSGSLSQPVQIALPGSSRRMWITAGAAALIAIAAIAFGVWGWRRGRSAKPAVAYSSMRIERLTSSGQVRSAVISPDGKYVAYVTGVKSGTALMVRQVATGSDVEVVPPQPTAVAFPVFSPDGNYVYYTQSEDNTVTRYSSLYQVPTLGGQRRKLIFDIDTAVSFSPDGKQFAFGRQNALAHQVAILIANADGTGERKLVTFPLIPTRAFPSWSPDGKSIVIPVSAGKPEAVALIDVDPVSGKQRRFGREWGWIGGAHWLPDGSGMAIVAREPYSIHSQIWLQPYPDGDPARVTNDLNAYTFVSVTGDGKTLAAVQHDVRTDLVLTTPSDAASETQFSPALANVRVNSTDAGASGAVVYMFVTERGGDIGIIDGPGQAPRVLTTDGRSGTPAVSADGKLVTYVSLRDGVPHVWVMNADGSGARQVTHGDGESYGVSRDGRTLFYWAAAVARTGPLMKMPVGGGAAVKVAGPIWGFGMSAAGDRLMFGTVTHANDRDVLRATVMTSDGKILYEVQPWATAVSTFVPGSDDLAYVKTSNDVANVFVHPRDGSPDRQLTHFTKGLINGIDFMPDGRLLLRRVESRSEVVLIKDFR